MLLAFHSPVSECLGRDMVFAFKYGIKIRDGREADVIAYGKNGLIGVL